MSNKDITTPGSILIKSMLPTKAARDAYDIHTPLDKSGVQRLVSNLVTNGGENSHEVIKQLADLFFDKATENGFSTPLDDYLNDDDERKAQLQELAEKVRRITESKKPVDQKTKELNMLVGETQSKLVKRNLEYMLAKGSVAARMARTGARGNPDQLASGTGSPIMAEDVKGDFIPVVIKHSFAEGLSPAEHLAMSYKGRSNTVMTQLSTALPGEVFKQLTPNLFHEVVTTHDCGTKNGILTPISDRKLLEGRFEAGTNREINAHYYREMHESGIKTVKVRSTITCEAKHGVCQLCYGIAANGRLPEIGFNVGVVASQSVSEVLTQGVLSTKHSAKVGGRQRSQYEQASNLLENPENFQDEATLSTLRGKVTKITQTPLKDHHIEVNGVSHFVPRLQDPTVKVGDSVRPGDMLSTGTPNPRQIVELKGLGSGRKYLSHALREAYGSNLDTRHFDLISKNLVKYVEVDHPGDSHFNYGDKIDIKHLEPYLESISHEVPIDKAHGKMVAKKIFEYTPGTTLSENHIEDLKASGVTHLHVADTTMKITPKVPGLTSAKLLDPNWISRMGFNNITKSLKDAAALGHSSDIHSTDPITSYVMGSEFGDGHNGRY